MSIKYKIEFTWSNQNNSTSDSNLQMSNLINKCIIAELFHSLSQKISTDDFIQEASVLLVNPRLVILNIEFKELTIGLCYSGGLISFTDRKIHCIPLKFDELNIKFNEFHNKIIHGKNLDKLVNFVESLFPEKDDSEDDVDNVSDLDEDESDESNDSEDSDDDSDDSEFDEDVIEVKTAKKLTGQKPKTSSFFASRTDSDDSDSEDEDDE